MAKNEITSLMITFFYIIFSIALTGLLNLYLNPVPNLTEIYSGAMTNPTAAMSSMMIAMLGSYLPIGMGFFAMIILIAAALILALFLSDRVAIGLIGASKVLLFYLGFTIVLFIMLEQAVLKGAQMVPTSQAQLPFLTLLTLIIAVICLVVFLVIGMLVGRPRRPKAY